MMALLVLSFGERYREGILDGDLITESIDDNRHQAFLAQVEVSCEARTRSTKTGR